MKRFWINEDESGFLHAYDSQYKAEVSAGLSSLAVVKTYEVIEVIEEIKEPNPPIVQGSYVIFFSYGKTQIGRVVEVASDGDFFVSPSPACGHDFLVSKTMCVFLHEDKVRISHSEDFPYSKYVRKGINPDSVHEDFEVKVGFGAPSDLDFVGIKKDTSVVTMEQNSPVPCDSTSPGAGEIKIDDIVKFPDGVLENPRIGKVVDIGEEGKLWVTVDAAQFCSIKIDKAKCTKIPRDKVTLEPGHWDGYRNISTADDRQMMNWLYFDYTK